MADAERVAAAEAALLAGLDALRGGGRDLVAGVVTLSGADGGTRIAADLDGTLAPLFPEAYAPYFAGTSSLDVDVVRGAG